MKTKHSGLIMGPAAAPQAPAATKFWNMASTGDDEGEITLYGDVMSQQPVDWWTGEPEPGLFITPEGFMEDLAAVKDKGHITVKLNSCGGDLYTGIAIHNALKALSGEVNVIVEGIAASAASVIMCAGDTVTVYPGSLIMIHGVSVMLWDYMNMQDMKQLMKGMDASERAVAEIYNSKTGIEVDTLRSMMTKETWFTGREALKKGFADAIKEDEDDPEMSMSADRKVLFVNGVRHNVDGLQHVPGTIPVKAIATPPAAKPGVNKKKPTAKAAKKEGGNKPMDEKELRAAYPEIVAQIEASARTEAQNASGEAAAAERQRIGEAEEIDLTAREERARDHVFGPEDLVILGAPVYAGRLPQLEGGIFERLRGDGTPAVFNVSYGNRAFEDALLEEQDICQAHGFHGIAAGAWIAPHTFSGRIGAGRPDGADLEKVREFAAGVRALLERPDWRSCRLTVPGDRPYRPARRVEVYPAGDESCTRCMACVSRCPAGAIPPESPRSTDTGRCISCLACVKNCPAGARAVAGPAFPKMVEGLEGRLLSPRREPELYYGR